MASTDPRTFWTPTDINALADKVASGTGGSQNLSQVLAVGNDAGGQNIVNVGDISLAGLTGATAAARFVGGTVSGHPTSGTFAVGDFVVDQSGSLWICTAAGSPGTWAQSGSGSGAEIGYDQITASVAVTSSTSATPTTIITCAAHTFDGGPVMVEFFAYVSFNSVTNVETDFALYEGGTPLFVLAANKVEGAFEMRPLIGKRRFSPTAGSHTYVLGGYSENNNGATVGAGTGLAGGSVPAYVRFTKV